MDFLNEAHEARIDDRQFAGSFFAYLRSTHGADSNASLGVTGMDDGPFADCPICAKCPLDADDPGGTWGAPVYAGQVVGSGDRVASA